MSEKDTETFEKQVFNRMKTLNLLSTGKFADFELICGNCTFKVHRAILVHSEFLERMIGGGFRESIECKGKISDEDPALVARFLMFLYTGSYGEGDLAKTSAIDQFQNIDDVYAAEDDIYDASKLHINMLELAHRICEERLRVYCLQRLTASLWKKRGKRTFAVDSLPMKGEIAKVTIISTDCPSLFASAELELGLDTTCGELWDFIADVISWPYLRLSSDLLKFPNLRHERRTLRQLDFENGMDLYVQTLCKKNPRLDDFQLERLQRGRDAIYDLREHDLVKFFHEHKSCEPVIWDMLTLEYIYRRVTRAIIPSNTWVELVRCLPDLFLDIETKHMSDFWYLCMECESLQLLKASVCNCNNWDDRCANKCYVKVEENATCFQCFSKGKLVAQDIRWSER